MPEYGASRNLATSVVRKRAEGVTVLATAEGRSLRSDPRWSSAGARKADILLGRLVARLRKSRD